MHLRKFAVTVATVLGLIFVVLLAAMASLETRWFADYLSDRVSERLGQNVQWAGPLHIDWSLKPVIQVENFRIENPQWAKHDALTRVDTISARIDLSKLFSKHVEVESLRLIDPAVHLMHSPEYGKNWAFLLKDDKKAAFLKWRIEEVILRNGSFTFLAPAQDTDIAIRINSPEGNELNINGQGHLLGEPITLAFSGDAIQEAANQIVTPGPAQEGYNLEGRIQWQEHRLQLEGSTLSLTKLGKLEFDGNLEGPNADALAQLFGYNAYDAPYQVRTQVQHLEQGWRIGNLTGHMGESEFQGQLTYQNGGHRGERNPELQAKLQLSSLNLDRVSPVAAEESEPSAASQKPWPKVLSQKLESLRQLDAEVELQVGHLQKQQVTVQNIHANLALSESQLSAQPLSLKTGGGQISLTGQVSAGEEWPKGEATVNVQNVDIGEALAPLGYQRLGKIEGKLKAAISQDALTVADSRLHYWDSEDQTDIEAYVTRRNTEGEQGVRLRAEGQLNGKALNLNATGGPLLDIFEQGHPYPLDADLAFADTEIGVSGTVTQPLRFKDTDINVHIVGPDPAQLWHLTGIAVPHLPAYELQGQLVREDQSWYLRGIEGKIGESDVSGNVRWDNLLGERPMLWADLHSRTLNIDDLEPLLGRQDSADDTNENDEVLPEGELMSERMRAADARIEFTGERVLYSGIPLKDIVAEIELDRGQLQFTPLSFGIGNGTVRVELMADANEVPMGGHVNIKIIRVSINDLLSPFEIADESYGRLGGQGDFNFTGKSLSQALANLQGEMQLVMSDGRLDATLVEMAGLDAGELVFGLFGDEPDPVGIQCAYARLNANGGIVDVESLTIATTDSNIVGDGEIDLQAETFSLVIEANPKDFSLFSGSSPIRIHGSFSDPKIDVISDELVARGALTALGAAVFPPTALLPLVELGETQGQGGCSQAVASAEPVAAQ